MVDNLDDAVRLFNRLVLHNEGKVTRIFDGRKGPIAKRLIAVGDAGLSYTVFYKTRWLDYFGAIYKLRQYTIGQTVNFKILREAERNGDTIGIVMSPDDKIYTCLASDWLGFVEENDTKRIPSTETEYEASVPKEMLTLFVNGKDKDNKQSKLFPD